MLKLFPEKVSNCETGSRRQFLLEVGALSAFGISLDSVLRGQAHASQGESGALADPSNDTNCILIWTRGGTSHHDTFDPKPNASADVRGDFSAISTALPGIQFTEKVPLFAKHAKEFSIMRNLNPQNGAHSTADAFMLSGHKFNPSVTYPCYGAVIAKTKGFKTNIPPHIQLGNNVDRRFNGGLGGYLGIQYNPFEIPGDPNSKNFTVRDISPPSGISIDRMKRRQQALSAIDTLQRQADQNQNTFEASDAHYQNAFSMITSADTQKAFDLSQESDKTRDEYGRHNLGQSCLLARRLIEAGSRFVTVSSGGWDTHTNNFKGLERLLPPFDQGVTSLVLDLKQRGMLDNTLVVWLTDFGRTPVINSAAGRDHWSTASTMMMIGAGTPAGQVVGATDDTGSRPVGNEYYPADVAATIYSKLGVKLDHYFVSPEDGRPLIVCEGQPIPELMG
ncbi:MAG: DUF1501 domain-containing protein [Gimesia chilikensis]|uniref:DUF1501 domain-containing protein n=1 Tax=Gimesia chilikensis TaxID=2605989 RepID=UPI0037A6DB54